MDNSNIINPEFMEKMRNDGTISARNSLFSKLWKSEAILTSLYSEDLKVIF